MVSKLVLESIKKADSGTVTCTLQTPGGPVQGVIEETFFQEFFGNPTVAQTLSDTRTKRVLEENQNWLEAEADKQLASGARAIVIR
ncbi:MAG: hypothetical protein COY40_01365 [Alphaproteobacteria bacterium CG_4_10_14_0_8_um_filter_53_9]|nr:MAG: hypothetical protein COY40_01365 [Alphaproteobacteria bacterium CG_4_10_14_0_8_um_filter_53_9]